MKTRVYPFIVLLAAISVSCSIHEKDNKISARVFYAQIETPSGSEQTKVYADEDLYVLWHADDRVSIFDKNTYNQEYRFTGKTGANAGAFEKVDNGGFITGNAISSVYSVYPFKESTEISNQGVLSVDLPATQSYAENSFGLEANTMVSVTSDNLLMYKNVGGYLRLSLYGDGVSVSSITLKGNSGEKLAGKASVTMPLNGIPSVSMANDATNEITLTCKTPVVLDKTAETSTYFWFVVPPVSFSQGFSVIVNTTDGTVYEHSTSKAIEISRNSLTKMASFEVMEDTHDAVSFNCSYSDITISKCKTSISLVFHKDIGSGVVGVLYSLDDNPVTSGNASSVNVAFSGTSNTDFSFSLSALEMNSEYFCVPFVLVGGQYIYGNISSFKTDNIESVTQGDYIDMGDGILWASSNLGAKKPTEAGDRYAWGELTTKDSYSLDNYSYYIGGDYIDIGNNIANTDYDVCRFKLGKGYRLPTINEIDNLFKSNSYAWTEYDGVVGIVIQANNGNSIFIPYLNTNTYSGAHTVEETGYTTHFYGYFAGFMSGNLSTQSSTLGRVLCVMICPELYTAPAKYKYNQVWLNGHLAREQGLSVRAVYDPSLNTIPIPEAVDLGLPSGVKWASFNLGASKPEEYGDYYAWGETEPKDDYSVSSYKWCMGGYDKLTKYCSLQSAGYNGFTDDKTVLDSEDDAAHINLGGNWRMPLDEEWTELREICTWEWSAVNGINGTKVTGPNGNSIFLPVAGFRVDTNLLYEGTVAIYWSSSLRTEDQNYALAVSFTSGMLERYYMGARYYGISVRPVKE